MKILVTGGSGFIGTNLTAHFVARGIDFVNLDTEAPKDSALHSYWVSCNILDSKAVLGQFKSYQPSIVIHLAAETDTDPAKKLEDYRANTVGTENVIKGIQSIDTVLRMVLTSTQFVNQREGGPRSDEDFAPHTIYGESKIISEKQLRTAGLTNMWTIIRPTNIWGPWHLRYPYEFWKVLAENKYFHPGRKRVVRSYGYVGNVVHQIMRIIELPKEVVHEKVYYVGDRSIDLYDWVNGFSLEQTGRKVTILPRIFVYGLAIVGEILRLAGVKFPITVSRYRSMTTNNPVDMEKTFLAMGANPYTLEEGIAITVEWMKVVHPHLVTKRP